MSTTLIALDAAKKALAEACTFHDVLQIRDKAEAVRIYVRAIGESLEAQNRAAEIKLRAERRAGEMLAELDLVERRRRNVRPTSHDATSEKLEDYGINRDQSSRWQREAKVSEEDFEKLVGKSNAEQLELTQAALLRLAGAGHVSQSVGENEWYTPPDIIARARSAMGGIDLDPASCDAAQARVKAKRFYTIADDGLAKRWRGRVWMNPPYSRDLCRRFIEKLSKAYTDGKVTQACVLVNNATETAWLQAMLKTCSGVCFPAGRITFLNRDGEASNSPLQGQVIAYLGTRVSAFRLNFADLGAVLERRITNENCD